MEYVTSTFRLPSEMYEKIRKEAYDEKVSLAEVIRQACEYYFENKALEAQGGVDETK